MAPCNGATCRGTLVWYVDVKSHCNEWSEESIKSVKVLVSRGSPVRLRD